MQQSALLTQAIDLTLLGMGLVFLFLTLLVLAIKLMSVILQKIAPQQETNQEHNLNLKHELDEETKFIIEQAIKLHRGA